MTNFFSDSYDFVYNHPVAAGVVLTALFVAAWAICRDKKAREDIS